MRDQVTSSLAQIVGRQHAILPEDDQEPYILDGRGRYRGNARAVVKPGSTREVADVVRLCAENGLVVTPQGGNTGMCGAATPPSAPPTVVVRLDRTRRVTPKVLIGETPNPLIHSRGHHRPADHRLQRRPL